LRGRRGNVDLGRDDQPRVVSGVDGWPALGLRQ